MKKRNQSQWVSAAMAAVLIASVLGGCSGNSKTTTTAASTTAASTTAASTTAAAAPEATTAAVESTLSSLRGNTSPSEEEITLANTTTDDSYLSDEFGFGSDYSAYPYSEDVTLEIWCPDLYGASYIWGTMNDHVIVKKIEELTGIHVNFVTPTIGEEQTAFNLMMGGNEFPDIIINVDTYYQGGFAAAEADGLILNLASYTDYLPNYMALLNSNEMRKKESLTDDGSMLCLYEHYVEPMGPPYGPRIKKAAMDKTGWTTPPETIDEWHQFLTDCKDAGYTVPLHFRSSSGWVTNGYGFLATAYDGAVDGLFVKDGKVGYGPMQDGLEDYLTMMKQWYDEGLIDPDFSTSDSAHTNAMIASDECAAVVTNGNSFMNAGVEYVTPLLPVLNKGDKPEILFDTRYAATGAKAAVTTKCKNVEAALALLDFGFSKKGWELYNFGTYGDVHLVNEEGIPYYPDDSLVYTDPEIKELGGNYSTSKYRIHHYASAHDEYNSVPGAVERLKMDAFAARDEQIGIRVPNVSLTAEESENISGIATNLNTARNEYCLKIIMGQLPMESIDEMRKILIDFGVEKYVETYQAAYDRFIQR